MNTKSIFLILATLTASFAFGSNAKIVSVDTLGGSTQTLMVKGRWDNSWRLNNVSTDAVYVFYKYRAAGSQQWEHGNFNFPANSNPLLQCNLAASGASGSASGNGAYFLNRNVNFTQGATTYASYKGACVRFQPGTYQNGIFDSTIFTLQVTPMLPNPLATYEFKFFIQEMVWIPQGNFFVGDGDPMNIAQISDNQPYLMGATFPVNTLKLRGLPLNSLPAYYPNGYGAFYVMKYALSNEAYADFLNMLTTSQQMGVLYNNPTSNNSWGSGLPSGVYVMRNSPQPDTLFRSGLRIFLKPGGGYEFKCDLNGNGIGNEPNDGQTVAITCYSARQANAYLEWAGLRPLTDLEFEKVCRGPLGPVPGEYAWGSSAITYRYNGDIVNAGTESEADAAVVFNPATVSARRCGSFARPSGSTRENTGASYYGVMDLSAAPRTYTLSIQGRLSNPGLALSTGNAGDGYLSATGGVSDATWLNLTYKQKVSTYETTFGGPVEDGSIYFNSVRGAISK
ncbi:MAG: hypothetical protein U0T84_07580 [Chitinophagales bacterium]